MFKPIFVLMSIYEHIGLNMNFFILLLIKNSESVPKSFQNITHI